MIGKTLAHYEILALLGKGGMGEVYRARDTKLEREVALKVLPRSVAQDAERLARFDREAKTLASLHDPHVAQIHGLDEAEGERFLVMELVEGEDLAERLKRGPIAIDEAQEIAAQIAAGLEAAHERSIVHRDLKPANVKVTPDGKVKLLDFGLARAYTGEPDGQSDPATSPTITAAMTQAGTILGTAAYMSPEQARGKSVDRRADIWALGVILYEMLTGRRLFDGETTSDTLAGVLKNEIDLDALPLDTPPTLRYVIQRCLERDPNRRLRDAGEARLALSGQADLDSFARIDATRLDQVTRRQRPAGLLALVALLSLAVITLATTLALLPAPAPRTPLLRAEWMPPEGAEFHISGRQPGTPAITHDGRRAAFVTMEREQNLVQLWVRALGSDEATRVPGALEASYPFFSPDGRSIAYFAEGKLKRTDLETGTTLVICDAPYGKGGSWGPNDRILFAPTYNSGIHVVSASGGEKPVPVTTVDRSQGENSHRHPEWLPDGEHFLYFARAASPQSDPVASVRVGSLESVAPIPVVASGGHALYREGKLLFEREGALLAQPFDLDSFRLTGSPQVVVSRIETRGGASRLFAAVADNGVMLYQERSPYDELELVEYDRSGRQLRSLTGRVQFDTPRPSPDERRIAYAVAENADADTYDLWLLDVTRDTRSRFTFDPSNESSPVWSPDGRRIAYSSDRERPVSIWVKDVDTGRAESQLLASEDDLSPSAWSPDGRTLLYTVSAEDLYALDLETGQTRPYLATPSAEFGAQFSPDGRWVAYASNQSGEFEIYLASFPEPDRKYQVSSDSGLWPWFTDEGREIVYSSAYRNVLQSVRLEFDENGDLANVGAPQTLFETRTSAERDWFPFGDGFMVTTSFGDAGIAPMKLISDWRKLLR